jgi:hypothetical protein
MFFQVIDNIIQFDRQIVGKLSKHIQASLRDSVVEALREYKPITNDDKDEDKYEEEKSSFELLKDKIFELCEAKSEAGMIELSDLETILETVTLDESTNQ